MNLKEACKEFLTQEEQNVLTKSFDTVGSIAITTIDETLIPKETLIAQALLKHHKHITTVVKKISEHEGKLRIQKYAVIGGENTTQTTVTENGVRLTLDINKTYYSVRSQNERLRVIRQVQNGERVLVMFSGIGPFSLGIAKHTQAAEIHGIELNADAHTYAEENMKKNKVRNLTNYCGDVREITPTLGLFDRIIMPLPHTAHEFLDEARNALTKNGTIHWYCFDTEENIKQRAEETITANERIASITQAGTYNPAVYRWCVDIIRTS